MRKIVLMLGALAITAITFDGCKDKCEGENPRARIVNNGTAVASVQIKTSDGNTVNINNVDPATASAFAEYASGNVIFTVTIGKNTIVDTVAMSQCFEYDIAIDANNNIVSTPKDRNE